MLTAKARRRDFPSLEGMMYLNTRGEARKTQAELTRKGSAST